MRATMHVRPFACASSYVHPPAEGCIVRLCYLLVQEDAVTHAPLVHLLVLVYRSKAPTIHTYASMLSHVQLRAFISALVIAICKHALPCAAACVH